MSTTRPNNASVVGKCTQRLNALKSHLTHTKATIAVNGVHMKADEVIATYQACLDGRATLTKQRADVKATLTTVNAADTQQQAVDGALKAWVVNQYGATSTEAHDFGFSPPKKPTRTVKSKATALERNQATREARHTMGSKQRQEVKGTMVVLTVPADPVNTVQPAPLAGGTPSATATTQANPAASQSQPVATAPNGVAALANGASH